MSHSRPLKCLTPRFQQVDHPGILAFCMAASWIVVFLGSPVHGVTLLSRVLLPQGRNTHRLIIKSTLRSRGGVRRWGWWSIRFGLRWDTGASVTCSGREYHINIHHIFATSSNIAFPDWRDILQILPSCFLFSEDRHVNASYCYFRSTCLIVSDISFSLLWIFICLLLFWRKCVLNMFCSLSSAYPTHVIIS